MKKIISLFLALCTVLVAFGLISCSKNDTDDENINNIEGDSDGRAFSTVRRADYGGYEFKILYFSMGDGLNQQDFDAETINGDVLNDLVFKKNSMVEEEYNIKLKLDLLPKYDLFDHIRYR